ncbi:hypothetical protein DESC_720054 [Desulfosarcina cetonica]|nr:hypothetical protein DESC_720054 [Desulfosarcina cetonica]
MVIIIHNKPVSLTFLKVGDNHLMFLDILTQQELILRKYKLRLVDRTRQCFFSRVAEKLEANKVFFQRF